jgi:uncharacterized protein (TIGR03435 family)
MIAAMLTTANAQTPVFEAATIKPSPPPDGHGVTVGCDGGPGTRDPGLLKCENMTLAMLVSRAFDINFDQMESPAWMMEARYNITARIPSGTTKEQMLPMWQQLLAERFHLAVHREPRVVQKYELLTGNGGARFKASSDEPTPVDEPHAHGPNKTDSDGFPELARPGMISMNGRFRLWQTRMTMAQLARTIAAQLRRPVSDQTGLNGEYDIRLFWAGEPSPGAELSTGPTLVRAVQDQLGLRLQATRGPVDFLVVDRADKQPTEN